MFKLPPTPQKKNKKFNKLWSVQNSKKCSKIRKNGKKIISKTKIASLNYEITENKIKMLKNKGVQTWWIQVLKN